MPVRRSRRKAAKKPRSKSSLAPGAIGLGVAALAAVPASAASFNVTNLNDNGAGSLRDALIQANTTAGDDVVTFQAGLTGTITLTTGQLYISDSVDIQGPGAAVITVSGGGSSRVLYMYNSAATLNVRVAGLTITQGVALNGAGIVDFYENLTLDAVVVSGNNAQGVGGGVAVGGDDATQLTIQNSTITGNNASGGGGVYVYYADINISDSQITENNAEGGAGLLANGGYNGVGPLATIQISDTTFSGNDASGDGGGVFLYNGDVTFDTVTIDQNTSSGNGAGLHLDGFFLLLTIQDSTISGNIATGDGGGIYLEDTGGPATIDRTNITGNHANDDGGGIYFYDPDAAVTVSDSTMSGNTADDDGGAFNVYDTDGAPLTFQRTTISGNTAANSGGAFFFYEPDDAVVFENCTISGNTATTGSGGGIYFYNLYSGLALNFVTVAGNQAALDGGGVYLRNGIATINNSIAADNTSAGNMDLAGGGAFDLRFSLVEAPGSASINNITGNILGSDPALGALANNGGPTQTQRPGPASVVINAADPGIGPPPTTDQRGQPRFYPTRADMGAVEIVGGVIQFNPQNYQVQENGGSANLTVVRDVGPDPASASYTTNPGSATPGVGNDYTTTSGTVNFAAGDLSEPIVVPILDDNTVEGNEQFTVPLSNPSGGASIGAGNPANVTIVDVEPGQLVFSSATYSVGEQGGSVTITVNRINGSTGASSVQYTTNPGSATPGAGNDYTTTSGTLMWNDGDAAPKSFNVPILDDNAAEGNEQFTVTLSNPVNSTIGVPGTATVTITDDPAGTVQFSVATINTTEESGSVTVTVTRTGGTEGAINVTYMTLPGTALAGSDYTNTAGVLTFPAGSATSQTFNIPLVNDSVAEGQEMFTVNLTGANVGSPSTLSIVLAASDEDIPTLSFFGKILFGIMSAIVGLYAIVRNRFSVMLLGIMLLGLVAAPPLHAADKPIGGGTKNEKEIKADKYRGTIQSITNNGTSIVVTLTGGQTFTISTKTLKVVDFRSAKPQPGTIDLVKTGANVIVKVRKDKSGNVKKVKIKILA